MRTAIRTAILALAVIAAAIAIAPAAASAAQTHLIEGTFGSANEPSLDRAIHATVDQSSDAVLVIEVGANRISRYHADGTPSNFPALGTNVIDGAGPGADETPQNGLSFDTNFGYLYSQIAVDNSGTATDGNIYVTQNLSGGGTVQTIEVFAASGEYLGRLSGAGGTSFAAGGEASPCGVAVDAAGSVYVGGWLSNKIYKFEPAGNPPLNGDHVASFDSPSPCGLAAGAGPSSGSLFAIEYLTSAVSKLDSASGALEYVVFPQRAGDFATQIAVNPANGHVFVSTGGSNSKGIREFDATQGSGPVAVSIPFGGGSVIAVEGASSRVYGVETSSRLRTYGPLVTVPDVSTDTTIITGLDSATVRGTVNPDGEPLIDCHFQWGLTASYGNITPCEQTLAEIGDGTAPVSVSADLSGLDTPGVVYHFRLVAENANAAAYPEDPLGTIRSANRTFTTPDQPSFADSWAIDVGITEATARAEVNPKNDPTTFRVEYGTAGPCSNPANQCAAAPDPEASAGSDDSLHTVGHTLEDLQPDTTYHWRIVATNSLGTTEGPDRSFTTYSPFSPNESCPNQAFRIGPSALLSDCRAYEMVSPVDKNGGDAIAPSELPGITLESAHFRTSADGRKLTYNSAAAFADAKAAPWSTQYLASRSAEGWSSKALNPPQETQIDFSTGNLVPMFDSFNEDLSRAWLHHVADPQPDPAAVPGYKNLYHRDIATDVFTALTTVTPPTRPPGTEYHNGDYNPSFGGFAEDGSRVILAANDRLIPGSSIATDVHGDPIYQLYEREGSTLRLVSRLPGGGPSNQHSMAGGSRSFMQGAVSADGSKVYWTTGADLSAHAATGQVQGSSTITGKIYVRVDATTTIAVSESVTESGADQRARFWQGARDGSAALFSFVEGPLSGNLYRFDLASETSSLIATGVVGVGGASEDLKRGFFVSRDSLDPAPNSQGDTATGQQDIYHYDVDGGIRFVASPRMSSTHSRNPGFIYSNTNHERFSEVSPDGQNLLFVAYNPLTGFDSSDATTGFSVSQVFRYSASGDRLNCVSCNPSGARPTGQARWRLLHNIGALFPAWRQGPFYRQRSISEDGGRVFFHTFDRLLPADVNGKLDVYEWRAPGSGDCGLDNPHYFAENEGCLSLISTGKSAGDSEFLESSPDGSSVFLRTDERLSAHDTDDLLDIYSARVGGGLAPPPIVAAPCEGEGCRDAAPASPLDAGAGTAAFEGPGNGEPGAAPKSRCARIARKARLLNRSARGLRVRAAKLSRLARRSASPRRARAARRQAKRLVKASRKRSRLGRRHAAAAKRCRAMTNRRDAR